MIKAVVFVAVHFIQLTGPDGQRIEINPEEIVSIREPRSTDHFAPGTKCILFTSDSKYSVVQETCEAVDEALKANHNGAPP